LRAKLSKASLTLEGK